MKYDLAFIEVMGKTEIVRRGSEIMYKGKDGEFELDRYDELRDAYSNL